MSQTYSTHRRFVPIYHYVLAALLVATLIGAVVNLLGALGTENLYSASLILALTVALIIVSFVARTFALKAQDRAIRAEESFRYYILAGSRMDPQLTMRQVIALRFASDDELLDLAARAVREGLSEDAIKRAVRSWRTDDDRV